MTCIMVVSASSLICCCFSAPHVNLVRVYWHTFPGMHSEHDATMTFFIKKNRQMIMERHRSQAVICYLLYYTRSQELVMTSLLLVCLCKDLSVITRSVFCSQAHSPEFPCAECPVCFTLSISRAVFRPQMKFCLQDSTVSRQLSL